MSRNPKRPQSMWQQVANGVSVKSCSDGSFVVTARYRDNDRPGLLTRLSMAHELCEAIEGHIEAAA